MYYFYVRKRHARFFRFFETIFKDVVFINLDIKYLDYKTIYKVYAYLGILKVF